LPRLAGKDSRTPPACRVEASPNVRALVWLAEFTRRARAWHETRFALGATTGIEATHQPQGGIVVIGDLPKKADGPSPHLAALIEDMEAHMTYGAMIPAAPPAPPVRLEPIAIRRTPVSEARDPRFEPSAKPLIITIATFVLGLGGILFWMS
jgi:hypothetical protein